MAKRKQIAGDGEGPSPRVKKHMAALGCRKPDAYLNWCTAHRFRADLDKTHAEMEAELAALAAEKAEQQRQARLQQNPRKLIEELVAGRIGPEQVSRPQLARFCRAIAAARVRGGAALSLQELLLKVYDDASFLLGEERFGNTATPYVEALIRIDERRGQWVRPLADWRPSTHNARRQFSSLVRHLLARYPVPLFMDQAWFRDDSGSHTLRDWFVHIGAGKNIRTAKTPFPLTKAMAHHFLEAPHSISIEGAIRWGQIHALGGDGRLVEAVLGTRIGTSFAEDEFWTSVIRFFIANPMLDRRHVGPIVDYLHNQRFEERQVFGGHGRVVREPPPQPNLSMRGRSADALLGQVEAWHRELGRTAGGKGGQRFNPSGIKALDLVSGREDRQTIWRIRELLTTDELAAEGRAMRHCVASYARSCAAGRCSIWTMELSTPSGTEKRTTIEVTRDGLVIQCRGKMNRLPSRAEHDVLREWARYAGLVVSDYVRVAA
jgi:hypothetical protein